MTRIVVTLGFLVAFAAGVVVGLRPSQSPQPTSRLDRHRGWLAEELNLDARQQQELDRIWSETAFRGRHEREEQRRELARQRDEAIAALIRPEDRPKYEAVKEEYSRQKEQLDREVRIAFETAVEKTRQILTPEQRSKYEELLERHQRERGRRDWRHGGRDRDRGPKKEQPETSPSA